MSDDVLKGFSEWAGKRAFIAERVAIYEDIAEAIEDQESLQLILKKRTQRAAERKAPIAHLYTKWLQKMGLGINLSEAAREDLPMFDYMVLSSFERSGKVHDGMRFLTSCLGKLQEANSAMKSAMVGPGVVMFMAIGMIVLFSLYAVPMVAEIYPPTRWPFLGKILYSISQVVNNYGILLALTIVGFIFSVIYSLPRLTGPFRDRIDRMPVYSTYRKVNGLTVLVGMSAQLKVGVSLIEAVRTIAAQSSPYIRYHLEKVERNLMKVPDAYGKAFKTGLLDDEILYRLVDFSERSSFPRAVERVGLESFDKVINGIKASAKTMGGVATAFSGFTVAFLIVSFLFTAQGIQKDVQNQMGKPGSMQSK